MIASIFDGKNMTEDFIEDLADSGKVVRSKKNGIKRALFFRMGNITIAEWREGDNKMKLYCESKNYIPKMVDELHYMFHSKDSDTYFNFKVEKNKKEIIFEFWKKPDSWYNN